MFNCNGYTGRRSAAASPRLWRAIGVTALLPLLPLVACGAGEDATADNSAVVAKIKEHKWWAEPPISQAKIDGLVSNITQAYGTETVVFDAKCKSWSTVVTSESPDMVAEVIKKTGMKAPPAFVRMTGQDKWSKTRALAELLKALDEAEARKAAAK